MKRINLVKVFTVFLLMMFFYNTYSQENKVDKINQFNSKGQKEGLWVDSSKYRIFEIYYKDGINSGVFKEYNSRGRLLVFGEYQDGKRSGTWYYFDVTGFLWMVFKDFSKNTASIINEGDGKRITPDYKCYSISYYPNGNIQNEGLLLWSEGEAPESDFSTAYGAWKYYDETGKLLRIEEFK